MVRSSVGRSGNKLALNTVAGAGIGRATAEAYAREGRRVEATDIAAQAERHGRPVAEVRREFEARQAMGRIGKPEEIAALAVYLASDESAFTTGAIPIVGGGFSL